MHKKYRRQDRAPGWLGYILARRSSDTCSSTRKICQHKPTEVTSSSSLKSFMVCVEDDIREREADEPYIVTEVTSSSSLKSFMVCVEDDIREREADEFVKGLHSEVKLDLYRRCGGKREFKKYLHGRSDEVAKLLFKSRSGTHGLNEELVIEMVGLNVHCVVQSARV